MIIDWHVHAGEAEFFERYPGYTDAFKKFWEPFIRLYGIDFPNGDPKEMVAGFKAMPLAPGFMDRFLGDNARRLLKL
jgi:hypothetical protein